MTYVQPLTVLLLAMIAAGLLGLRRHAKSIWWRVAAGGLLGMVILTWPPIAALMAQPFTCWYPKQIFPTGSAEAIVVLSGSASQSTSQRPYVLVGRDTYRRAVHAAWLYHHWKALPILATGGSTGDGAPLAVTMRRLLEQEGVPPANIWTEERSRSTYENALYSARILRERGIQRIALVVEADGMLRAEKCFRKQGLGVTPAPCLFSEIRLVAEDLLPGWEAISREENLAHEAGGLVWYWIHGWI